MGYSVKIGGSPSVPGSTYASAVAPRYGRGINRPGFCFFDLYGLDGNAAPNEGDYVQVVYDGTVVWDGFIREVKKEIDDIVYKVTASDALGLLGNRDVDARQSYASQTEGSIFADILSQVGITTATTPVRTGTAFAGATFTSYRVEYANSLKQLRALAMVNGRELSAGYDGASGTTQIHYRQKTGDYSASQATWQGGTDLIRADAQAIEGGAPTLQTDDWEKRDEVRILGQGDGTQSDSTYGATTGTTGDRRGIVPAKGITDAGVAGSLATTFKAAFADSRKVIVCPTRFFNLEVDQGINLGDRVTVQDFQGNSLGDFRIIYLEADPEYRDGFFTRVTLIRATTSGGGDFPALPTVAGPHGETPPGLHDMDTVLNDPLTHTQNPATSGSTRIGASQADAFTSSTGLGQADGAGFSVGLVYAVASFDPAVDEGFEVYIEYACTDAAGTVDLQVVLNPNVGASKTLLLERVATPDTSTANRFFYVSAQSLVDLFGMSGTMNNITLSITNRSGAARDLYAGIGVHVVKQHVHVGA